MRVEGEPVYYNDKVTLHHKAGGGQYLGLAGKTNIVVSYNHMTEGWTIRLFKKYKDDQVSFLYAG
jgi:hypothetical protein